MLFLQRTGRSLGSWLVPANDMLNPLCDSCHWFKKSFVEMRSLSFCYTKHGRFVIPLILDCASSLYPPTEIYTLAHRIDPVPREYIPATIAPNFADQNLPFL